MNKLKKQSLIKLIATLCGKLKIGSDERHAIQKQVTGKSSLKEMSLPELEDVVAHLRRIEAAKNPQASQPAASKPGKPWAFVFRLPEDRQRLAKKLYRQAERIGALQTPPVAAMSPEYMAGAARQMLGYNQPGFENVVVRLELATAETLRKMVQAMETHLRRKAA